ncbi:hypothetical protein FRC12_023212, partial [Ceratobasidium sp. 428]
MDQHDSSVAGPSASPDIDDSRSSRPQVQRGARACTVCRQAKMRCIGADDGQTQCQRCKRSNLECVFEKHRRGRKPGSKLSEASKMLRRIEKGLNNERRKSQVANATGQAPFPISSSRTSADFNFANSDGFMDPSLNKNGPANGRGPNNMASNATTPTATESTPAPPLTNPPSRAGTVPIKASSPAHHAMDGDNSDDDDDREPSDDGLFPARLLAQGSHSPDDTKPSMDNRQTSVASTATVHPIITGPEDPISAGLMDEAQAKVLFDLVFLRLNPFINLFDPVLHTVPYVRSRCPFLFTCLVMAGCKFWKPELFKQTQRLANEFVIKAFADQWKRVEVVQAFACMTYWKEPEDTRTYTYIGY